MQNIFFIYAVKIQQENVTDSKMKHSLISSPYILYFNPEKQLYLCSYEKISLSHINNSICRSLQWNSSELVEVDLWLTDICPSCKEKKQSHHCCSTETQFIKMTVDQNVDQVPTFDYTPVTLSLLFDIRELLVLSETDESISSFSFFKSPPECSGAELCIRNCSFLI